MNIRYILSTLLEAATKALNLHNEMASLGYPETPYFDLYGETADVIYSLIGEKTTTFEESVTYKTLNDPKLDVAQQLDALMNEYQRNELVYNPTMHVRSIIKNEARKRNIDSSDMLSIVVGNWAMNNDPVPYPLMQ